MRDIAVLKSKSIKQLQNSSIFLQEGTTKNQLSVILEILR